VNITRIETWRQSVPLTRPYTIAYQTIDKVDLHFVRLFGSAGQVGLGSAAPATAVTGETSAACAAALAPEGLAWLEGQVVPAGDADTLAPLLADLAWRLPATPAARAALDMALHDLQAGMQGLPLADHLGRCHDGLPTSVTIGILPADATIDQAREHLAAGFTHLKLKLGQSCDEDLERLRRLRAALGPGPRLRVDANQGYTEEQTLRLAPLLDELDLELVEQPLPAAAVPELRRLPAPLRRRIAADESLLGLADAEALAGDAGGQGSACGIFNIKLMKCGGIGPARAIAATAARHHLALMWGCNDESVIGIAAALHTAYATPATRYLDLDGSFDLAGDPATGGFRLQDGRLYLLNRPGLGVSLDSPGGSPYP
jgi:L-alanine-DL-glutamate epimerase-like enolase superfamily enzyme